MIENKKEFVIIKSPNKNFSLSLRIPNTDKFLRVTCPSCGTEFLCPQKISWIKNAIKNHPFFFGLIITLYLATLTDEYLAKTLFIKDIIFIHGIYLAIWLVGNWILNSLVDKNTKWYFQKWFVLIMLFILPPVGITILWVGSNFSKFFKIVFSILFSFWFGYSLFTINQKYFLTSPQEYIIELISSKKGDILFDSASYQAKERFQEFILSTGSPLWAIKETLGCIPENKNPSP